VAPVRSDVTGRTRCGAAWITDRDWAEIAAFKRFLSLGVRPDDHGRIPREFPGWLPYVLGWGPAPPVDCDRLPVTAWSFPS
jgi:hypothetical protein